MTQSNSNFAVKTDSWEAEHVRVEVPLYPILDRQSVQRAVQPREARAAGEEVFQMRGARSFVTSVGEADKRAQDLIRECKRRIQAGEFSALIELLRDHPILSEDVSVRRLIVRYAQTRRMHQKPGRQPGSFERCPLVVVGLVSLLIEERLAPNRERAFARLEEMGLVKSYEAAKKAYHRTLGDDRFRAVLARFAGPSNLPSARELEEWVRMSPMLQSGESASFALNCPDLGIKR